MPGKIASEYQAVTTGYRFFLLFIFLLSVLILYPYAETSRFGYYALRVLGSAVIVVSVYAISLRRSVLIFALILAVPALVQRLRLPEPTASTFSILNIVLSFTFDVYVVIVIFRRVFAREQTNSETVFGALCIYLLVGFSFASVYGMIAALQPHAFYLDPLTNHHAIADRFDFIYYSYGTMTSLGATGITPVSAQARSVTIVEAILGVLYLAVLVARLIGAYRPTPGRDF
ncbi:MAG: ion channel [Candidatus Acidiferrales bacterium]